MNPCRFGRDFLFVKKYQQIFISIIGIYCRKKSCYNLIYPHYQQVIYPQYPQKLFLAYNVILEDKIRLKGSYNIMGDKAILNFDESGNIGRKGKYFTIACIESKNIKPLSNIMKKTVLKTKKTFPEYESFREIKAKDSYPAIKDYFLRKIVSKDINIRYIVADLEHVKQELKDDENLLYNYMLQFLIVPVAKQVSVDSLVINLDKRTIKVKSTNSFADYIRIKLNYELGCNVSVEVNYIESHNSYAIQAADFVANAINTKYKYGHTYYYDLISKKVVQRELFPYKYFGQSKVVSFG